MKASKSTFNLWVWFLLDGVLWVLSIYAGLWLRFQGDLPAAEYEYFLRFTPLSTAGLLGGFFYCGVYRRDIGDDWSWRALWWGWVGGVALSFATLFFLKIPYSRLGFMTGAVLFFALAVVLRSAVTLLDAYRNREQRVVALGYESEEERRRITANQSGGPSIQFRRLDPDDPAYRTLQELEPDFILVNGEAYPGAVLRELVDFGSRVQIPVRLDPAPQHQFFAQMSKVFWRGNRLLRSELHYRLQQQMALKTVFDYVMGSVLFLLALPLLLLVGLFVYAVDGRPVLYTQSRSGRGGTEFTVYKFRTMVPDADRKGPELTEGADDPRITRWGRWLRRWSLDELPQLWNVLKGEMSLVGPRPEIPSITGEYDPSQQRVLWLKPGLTGLSQVRGRQDLELDEKLRIDQEYLTEYSIGLDLWILLKTIITVLRGEGAA